MLVRSCYWKKGEEIGSWPKRDLEPNPTPLSAMMRRRLTPLGQKTVEMFYRSSSHSNPENIPWVVSSRHGDGRRMLNLLSNLARKELLSPTDFSMSVHNAIVGTFSIATKNKKTHSALSGAELSFEAGLFEAFALQKEKKGTVGYIYYDMPLPLPFEDKVGNDCSEVYVALVLSECGQDKEFIELFPETLYLDYERAEEYSVNKNSSSVSYLLGFLKNDAKRCKISVPGGYFLLERIRSKA